MIPLTLALSHGGEREQYGAFGHPLRGRFASTRPLTLCEGDGLLPSPLLRGLYPPSRTPCEHRFACSRPPRFAKGRVLR